MWLTLDPGETTGWSLWERRNLLDSGQHELWEMIDLLDWSLREGTITFSENPGVLEAIVCEDWKLYEWEAQNLVWDSFRTVRGIGAFTLLARQNNIPFILQPATIKEAAVAAGAEELFSRPLHENRHANDAIMHGVFYLASHKNQAPGYGA